MLISPDVMRALLVICMLGMALLAVLFLRQRSLSTEESMRWGLLLLLPLIGPFLVILLRPGVPRQPGPPSERKPLTAYFNLKKFIRIRQR